MEYNPLGFKLVVGIAIVLFVIPVLIAGLSSDSGVSSEIKKTNLEYCQFAPYEDNVIEGSSFTYDKTVTSADIACADKKKDFFGKPAPKQYKKCVFDFERSKKKSAAKKCEEINTASFKADEDVCDIKFLDKSKQIISMNYRGEKGCGNEKIAKKLSKYKSMFEVSMEVSVK